MSENQSASSGGGIGVGGLLGVAFVVLKLTHVIDWSWWWVTSPFWIPLAIAAAVFVACGLVALIGLGVAMLIEWFTRR